MYQFTIPQAFWDGECFDAYRWMGAHPSAGPHGEAGWQFTLFASAAQAVSVCGSWPGGEDVPMEKNEAGFWRVYIPGVRLPPWGGGPMRLPISVPAAAAASSEKLPWPMAVTAASRRSARQG